MSKIIECENITHYYGNRLIYENLSFDVEQGKVLGLLGKNGTGKTTIINILNGYLKPRSGVCRLFGEEMEHLSSLTKSKVGLLLEGHVQHAYFIIRKTKRCGFPKRKVSKIRKFQKRNVFYLFKHTKGRENQNNPFPCLLFYTFNSNRTSSLPPIRLIVLSMLFS